MLPAILHHKYEGEIKKRAVARGLRQHEETVINIINRRRRDTYSMFIDSRINDKAKLRYTRSFSIMYGALKHTRQ